MEKSVKGAEFRMKIEEYDYGLQLTYEKRSDSEDMYVILISDKEIIWKMPLGVFDDALKKYGRELFT